MGFVEHIKWWQWIIISLLLGALLGYVNSRGADTPTQDRSMSQMTFENKLLSPIPDPKNPRDHIAWISHVVVHPVRALQQGDNSKQVQLVTFDCVAPADNLNPKARIEGMILVAPFPFEPRPMGFGRGWLANQNIPTYPGATLYRAQRGDTLDSIARHFYGGKATQEGRQAIIDANEDLRDPDRALQRHEPPYTIHAAQRYWIPWDPAQRHSITDFLGAVNQALAKSGSAVAGASQISFHYAWWEVPKTAYELWMIGTFLAVGLIWPGMLWIMLRGGLGRAEPDKYDLSRFKGGKEPAAATATKGMTQDDAQKLRELEESLAASLRASDGGAAPAVQAPSPPEPVVKKLTAADGPAPSPARAAPQEDKTYAGEFYPVSRPGGKDPKNSDA